MYSFIDTHSHIHGSEFDADRAEILSELALLGGATIAVGTDYAESERARKVAEENPHVYFCAGIHPVDKRDEVFEKKKLKQIASHPKCVGIGECGLDYYWPKIHNWYSKTVAVGIESMLIDDNNRAIEYNRQINLFKNQIDLAIEMNLPLMIHGRPSSGTMDAYLDIIHILKEYKEESGDKLRGNIHFFVGNVEIAKEFLTLGFTMSFTGVITFSTDYDEVIRFLPIESIQAETDSPYVAPKPFRGKRNEPKNVREVIKKIAELKSLDIEFVEKNLMESARRIWRI